MTENKLKLKQILNDVKDGKLILPDFQRDYVWIKQEDKVENFIASVLAQLPIGSFITFNGKFSSFANKTIGFNDVVNNVDPNAEVSFLLDGQQRITTLDLFFSDRIFEKIRQNKELLSKLVQKKAVLRRYFIQLPKYYEDDFSEDLLGFKNLYFKLNDYDTIDFCSTDIIDMIVSKKISFSEPTSDTWYEPRDISRPSISISKGVENTSLIPLYMLTDYEDTLDSCLEELARSRKQFILEKFPKQKINDLKKYLKEHYDIYNINVDDYEDRPLELQETFEETLSYNTGIWKKNISKYLTSCISNLKFNVFEITDGNIGRAINMYESLNLGGVKLSTYDLIIARAASYPNKGSISYAESNKNILRTHCNPNLFALLAKKQQITEWNSVDFMNTISTKEDISPKIINQFLNLLCFVSDRIKKGGFNNELLKPLSNECCKAKKQLEMTSFDVCQNSELVLKSLIDTLMILQFKCGICSCNNIDYDLILLPLSYLMYLYNSKNTNLDLEIIVDRIVALYTYLVFSDAYQLDQSQRVMDQVVLVHNWCIFEKTPEIFVNNKFKADILSTPKYNDFETLIFESDAVVKAGVKNAILNFILSRNPYDLIIKGNDDDYITLKAWDKSISLEIHHIIPLATGTSIKESTKELRNKKGYILNSPLNLVAITKEANRTISSYQVKNYKDCLHGSFVESYLFENSFINYDFTNDEKQEKVKEIFENRFMRIKNKVIKKIEKSLQ